MEGSNYAFDRGRAARSSNSHAAWSQKEYSISELEHFLAFFPSHFTLNLPGSSLKFRHLLGEVTLSLNCIPPKYSAPHLNLMGFLYTKQGNHKIALRCFRDAQTIDDKSLLSISNEAHCHLRQRDTESALRCVRKLMSLTSSPTTLTGDTKWVSESKADLGYTYNMFGLSNAATRMFTTALQYNKVNVNAQYGLAHALFSLAQSKGRIQSNLKTAEQLVLGALKGEPEYIPALILNLRIKSLIRGLTDTQIEHHFSSILKKGGAKGYVNALVYRDLAIIQMGRREYEGKFGAITLLNSSLETEATSQSHFLLGKAVYGSWLRNTESNESKESMLAQVKSCHSKAMSMSHNCRADITVELARIEEEMGDLETAYQLYKLTLVSEDVSIQECAYRRLSFLEKGEMAKEAYMREAMRLSHLVRITPDERMEFWDLVYRHAETIIQEKSTTHAFPWITALAGAQHPKADLLVEMYDKEHHSNPIKGGEAGTCTDKKSGAAASRKQSKSISKLV